MRVLSASFLPVALLALGSAISCSRQQSPFDSGPLGPKDPIFWKMFNTHSNEVYLPDIKPHPTLKIPQSRLAPGEAGGSQSAPPRLLISNKSPGETFGSAAGRTYVSQNLFREKDNARKKTHS
jgi:hypothetical protein